MGNGRYPDDPLMEINFSIRGLAKEIENANRQHSTEADKIITALQQLDKAIDRLPGQVADKVQAIVERHVIVSSAESMADFKKMIDDVRHSLYLRQLSGTLVSRTSLRDSEREDDGIVRRVDHEDRRSSHEDTAKFELKKTGQVNVMLDTSSVKKAYSVIKWVVVTCFAGGGIVAMIRSIVQAIRGKVG